jgi:hypothetical protein
MGKATARSGRHFEEVMRGRRQEADQFYASVIPSSLGAMRRM